MILISANRKNKSGWRQGYAYVPLENGGGYSYVEGIFRTPDGRNASYSPVSGAKIFSG